VAIYSLFENGGFQVSLNFDAFFAFQQGKLELKIITWIASIGWIRTDVAISILFLGVFSGKMKKDHPPAQIGS
jgi:hypothetical protein